MIGTRIRQARLLAGMSQQDIADALDRAGIPTTKIAVSKFERGKEMPDASVLMALSRFFNVPLVWLMHEPKLKVKWLAYRKHSALPAKVRESIEVYARDVAELHLDLQSLLFPHKNVVFPERINVSNIEEAEEAAGILRMEWGLDDEPIASLTQAAENNGVIVIDWDRPTERFDGLSGWCKDERAYHHFEGQCFHGPQAFQPGSRAGTSGDEHARRSSRKISTSLRSSSACSEGSCTARIGREAGFNLVFRAGYIKASLWIEYAGVDVSREGSGNCLSRSGAYFLVRNQSAWMEKKRALPNCCR